MCCSFHEDKTPSLKITPTKNLFHCFGCGIGGLVIDWVIKTPGVSFRHAVELLKEGESTSSSVASVASSSPVKLASLLSENTDQ